MLCCFTLYKKAYTKQGKNQNPKKTPQNKTKINPGHTPEIVHKWVLAPFYFKPATHKLVFSFSSTLGEFS